MKSKFLKQYTLFTGKVFRQFLVTSEQGQRTIVDVEMRTERGSYWLLTNKEAKEVSLLIAKRRFEN